MHRFPSFLSIARRLGTTGLLLIFAALPAGCTTITPPQVEVPARNSGSVAEASPPALIPVVRYGRYTLVELMPEPAQRDLLQQTLEVSIPPTLNANVGDAMRHVLLRSGYRLCDAGEAASLYALPLPAAHLRLGPLMLRDALLTLAGPAWELSVDDSTRQVCFSRRGASTSLSANPPGTATPVPDADRPEELQP
ncbi:PFGI-1 class ICE element type IV pilus protein PilL2 [Methylibium petroleiphilum]|uniref:PilL protein n=1 Tax=Methylibium petroleiphilum (strain ATCC BAA-1232 / LMG 22953 / PM1) TaxID=420662 RepID=A2SIE1_METPP|nr:PilL N-terminal domain-containing protein [Methylibium petroleiphilum]ABM95330.1 conserved hypothetical protein [Methylibium petroleiphilum PM1]